MMPMLDARRAERTCPEPMTPEQGGVGSVTVGVVPFHLCVAFARPPRFAEAVQEHGNLLAERLSSLWNALAP